MISLIPKFSIPVKKDKLNIEVGALIGTELDTGSDDLGNKNIFPANIAETSDTRQDISFKTALLPAGNGWFNTGFRFAVGRRQVKSLL